ncbi:MAG: ankyrin repeat domain-containing protein [Alphaproteobacteria bacterium]
MLAVFAGRQEAEAALRALRHDIPDQLVRLTHRTGPAAPWRADRRPSDGPDGHRPTSSTARSLCRLVGALGMVALVALASAAHWVGTTLPAGTTRSAIAADAVDAEPEPAEPAPANAADALLGAWATAEAGCDRPALSFLADREIRSAADGSAQSRAVTGYSALPQGLIGVNYGDGDEVVYAVDAAGAALVSARLGDIAIAPQRPLSLQRCGQAVALARSAAAAPSAVPVAEAFRLAIQAGDDLAAALTIAHGLSVSSPLAPGDPPPLLWAVAHERPVLIGKLVAAGADPDLRDGSGRTGLAIAVERGNADLAEALLAAGADPRIADPDGNRPLDIAAAKRDELMIDILLSYRP